MSVGMNPSYLTNLDFQMTVNHDGVSISHGGVGGSADREFARQVGFASGAAMAELLDGRGAGAGERISALDGLPGLRRGERVTIRGEAAPVPYDPVILTAKEITKQDVPLPDAPVPVVSPLLSASGAEPAERKFDLPPQEIIDAKTIVVRETPIAPDGTPLEPVERKMIELAPDIFLPTPEDFQKQDEALRGAVKSFILPRREIERACNDSVNQLFEMYTNVLRRFVGMIQQGDERFELESTQSLVGYYLRIMGDQYRFLDEMCREYIPVSVMKQVDQINNTMNDVNSLLPILDDPNVMRAVSNVLRGFGSNASRLVQAAAARGLEGVEFVSSVIGAIVALVFGRNPSLRLN